MNRILFVGFTNSVHVARWIAQLAGEGFDIHLFPSNEVGLLHPALGDVTVHYRFHTAETAPDTVRVFGANVRLRKAASFLNRVFRRREAARLRRVVQAVRPQIVHSLEFQAASYLVDEAFAQYDRGATRWIATNYGSDIYHFVNDPLHEARIRSVLRNIDYYTCESERDVELAVRYGLERRKAWPVMPNAGGLDLDEVRALRSPGATSRRKLVVLKGYQGLFGRALTGLAALERCAELLSGYRVIIHSAVDTVGRRARELARAGLAIEILGRQVSHREMLRLHGAARVSMGLSVSDGISTSFLEALAMGSFPVQTNTSSAHEWVVDGVSGLLVPPCDVDATAAALVRALTDDALVDRAAEINWQTAERRLDRRELQPAVVSRYRAVLDGTFGLTNTTRA